MNNDDDDDDDGSLEKISDFLYNALTFRKEGVHLEIVFGNLYLGDKNQSFFFSVGNHRSFLRRRALSKRIISTKPTGMCQSRFHAIPDAPFLCMHNFVLLGVHF